MKKIYLWMLASMIVCSSAWAMNESADETAAADRSFNIRVNPLGLLVGEASVDLDFGVAPSITIGPSFGYLRATSDDGLGDVTTVTATAIGIRAIFYLSNVRFHDGWYISPVASYIPLSVSDTIEGDSYSASLHMFELTALAGYQWVWDSGFNVTLGLGISYFSTSNSVVVANSEGSTTTIPLPTFNGVVPALEFGLGWAF